MHTGAVKRVLMEHFVILGTFLIGMLILSGIGHLVLRMTGQISIKPRTTSDHARMTPVKMFLAHGDIADLERRADAARVHIRRARRVSTKWEFKSGRAVDGLLSDTEKLLDDILKLLRDG